MKEPKVKQKFCSKCGGVKVIKIDGKVVDPMDYPKYGFAIDLGCICS